MVEHDEEAGLGDSPASSTSAGSGDDPADRSTAEAHDAASDESTAEAHDAASDESDDEDYRRRLGQRLRAVRRAQSLRLQDVEQRSAGRFKAVVVGSYERGDRAVSAHKLAALAAFYGVPVSELLPEDAIPRRSGAEPSVRIAVNRLRGIDPNDELAPLSRLVQHVQWLRGDYHGAELALRGDDLRTVSVALGVEPTELESWLDERGLLVS